MKRLALFFLIGTVLFSPFAFAANDLAEAIRTGVYAGRRYLVAGEHVSVRRAQNLATLYGAPLRVSEVESTSEQSKTEAGARPSLVVSPTFHQEVIDDLKAINTVGGAWEIVVLREANGFFLSVLKEMGKGSLANVRGAVYLFGFQATDQDIVRSVNDASSGNLRVYVPVSDIKGPEPRSQ